MPRGGKREGAGRKPGSTNRHSPEIRELARKHGETAVQTLVAIAEGGESEAARVSAANAILDRGYGRPQQSHELTGPDGGPIAVEQKPTGLDAKLLTPEERDEARAAIEVIHRLMAVTAERREAKEGSYADE